MRFVYMINKGWQAMILLSLFLSGIIVVGLGVDYLLFVPNDQPEGALGLMIFYTILGFPSGTLGMVMIDVLKATIENIAAFLELGKTCIYNDHLGAQLCHSWSFSSAGDIYILAIFAWMNLALIFLYLYLFISRFTKYKK